MMKLTHKRREYIDSLSYRVLVVHWGLSRKGEHENDSSWHGGETGEYWRRRIATLASIFYKCDGAIAVTLLNENEDTPHRVVVQSGDYAAHRAAAAARVRELWKRGLGRDIGPFTGWDK